MTVGELIDALKHYPPDSRVETSDGLAVFVNSYVGHRLERVVVITDVEPPANIKARVERRKVTHD